MNTLVNANVFRGRAHPVPTLVLVDLHERGRGRSATKTSPYRTRALSNCPAVLQHARASGFPVRYLQHRHCCSRRFIRVGLKASSQDDPTWFSIGNGPPVTTAPTFRRWRN